MRSQITLILAVTVILSKFSFSHEFEVGSLNYVAKIKLSESQSYEIIVSNLKDNSPRPQVLRPSKHSRKSIEYFKPKDDHNGLAACQSDLEDNWNNEKVLVKTSYYAQAQKVGSNQSPSPSIDIKIRNTGKEKLQLSITQTTNHPSNKPLRPLYRSESLDQGETLEVNSILAPRDRSYSHIFFIIVTSQERIGEESRPCYRVVTLGTRTYTKN